MKSPLGAVIKKGAKRILPDFVVDWYHRCLAVLAAYRYRHPTRELRVIGVTGTNGKSTVTDYIARILEEAGYKVGYTSTVKFKIGEEEWLNDKKMTMLGRFALQKFLRRMVESGCEYAIIETSSEGLKQHRHIGIDYDVAVFTNLTPEHLESHGGFENYKKAKGKLFARLAKRRKKTLDGKDVPTVAVLNIADEHSPYFQQFGAQKTYGYLTEKTENPGKVKWPIGIVKAMDVDVQPSGSRFRVRETDFSLKMLGLFNVENALAAISVGLSQDVPLPVMAEALGKIETVPGRMEIIDAGQPFTALVDYAPEPASFMKLYEVIAMLPKARIIHVLGSCGGGRDTDRRSVLGRIAGKKADIVIVTNEDPYDDDPDEIIEGVAKGAEEAGKVRGEDLYTFSERGDAITFAVEIAKPRDLVVVTGKGSEQAIVVAAGRKIPWDDREKLREAIKTVYTEKV